MKTEFTLQRSKLNEGSRLFLSGLTTIEAIVTNTPSNSSPISRLGNSYFRIPNLINLQPPPSTKLLTAFDKN